MNNKCNICAKFLTCNREECKKISFVEAGILDKPRKIKRNYKNRNIGEFGISMQEAGEQLQKAMQNIQTSQYRQ